MDIGKLQPLLRAKGINVPDDDPIFLHLLLNQVVLDDAASGSLSNKRLNIDKLQGVLRSNGIRIENDDPVFVLLAINEIALDQMIEKQRQTLGRAAAQRRFPATLLLLVAGCIGIGAGIAFVRDSSHMVAGMAGMTLGVVLGALATWLWSSGREANASAPSPATSTPQHAYSWTESDFRRVLDNMSGRLDPRVQRACWNVLIAGATVPQAAEGEKLAPKRVMAALDQLVERKNLSDWLSPPA